MSKMGLLYFWFVYQSPGKHLFAFSTQPCRGTKGCQFISRVGFVPGGCVVV